MPPHCLGGKYEILMACIRHEGTFRYCDLGIVQGKAVHPCILKCLADRGYLELINPNRTRSQQAGVYRVLKSVREKYTNR